MFVNEYMLVELLVIVLLGKPLKTDFLHIYHTIRYKYNK